MNHLFQGIPVLFLILILNPTLQNSAYSQTQEECIQRGLKFLAQRQNEDGSFGRSTDLFGHDSAVAALCGLAFLASGSLPGHGDYGEQIDRIIDYLIALAEKSRTTEYVGLIADLQGRGNKPMYGHGFSTLFLAECYGMSSRPELKEVLQEAINLIVQTQNSEGGWRYEPQKVTVADISVTTCILSALHAVRDAGFTVPAETIENGTRYIKQCQNSNGGFRYMLTDGPSGYSRSAAAIFSLQSGGLYEGKEIENGIQYLSTFFTDPDPAVSGQPGEYYYYGQFYLILALWHQSRNPEWNRYWKTWSQQIYHQFLITQNPDGSWKSDTSTDAASAMVLCALLVSREQIPLFFR